MGKNINIFDSNIYTRNVLLSTGELCREVVIQTSKGEVYESSPSGLTIGNNEASILTKHKSKDTSFLNNSSVFNLSQDDFDKIISSKLNSQTSTALSLVHLRYLAMKDGVDREYLYQFVSNFYKKRTGVPIPIFNILNGGKHTGGNLSFCEFMIIPKGQDFQENVKIASEIYNDLRYIIKAEYGPQNILVGREGGFAPNISDVEHAVFLIKQAISKRNLNKCEIAIDVASNNFSKKSTVKQKKNFSYFVNKESLSSEDFFCFYKKLISKFPEIVYLEDPFHEDDVDYWRKMKDYFGKHVLIVGDDLTVTNINFLKEHKTYINACILKVNQVGTITDLIKSFNFCKKNNIRTIISQRSGETDSDIITHLAVGLGSDYIKAGAPARERIIKYNSLIRINDKLKKL